MAKGNMTLKLPRRRNELLLRKVEIRLPKADVGAIIKIKLLQERGWLFGRCIKAE